MISIFVILEKKCILKIENIPIYNFVEILKILMNTSVEILKLQSPLEHLQPTNYAYGTLW